jgi:heme-degrading monooxygenase HmoA
MIARTWRGTVHRADADEYVEHIRETGFAEYGQTPGNVGAWLLRHDDGDRTEFITMSLWDSVDAIRAFAGDDIDAVVLYPEDARYLVGESTVTHYQVVAQVQPAQVRRGSLMTRNGNQVRGLDPAPSP